MNRFVDSRIAAGFVVVAALLVGCGQIGEAVDPDETGVITIIKKDGDICELKLNPDDPGLQTYSVKAKNPADCAPVATSDKYSRSSPRSKVITVTRQPNESKPAAPVGTIVLQ